MKTEYYTSIFAASLVLHGDARRAFSRSIHALTQVSLGAALSPHQLLKRAGGLILDPYRAPLNQALCERTIIKLSDLLCSEISVFVYDPEHDHQARRVAWKSYALDVAGQEGALNALNDLWCFGEPVIIGSDRVSLDPVELHRDHEIELFEQQENASLDQEINRALHFMKVKFS